MTYQNVARANREPLHYYFIINVYTKNIAAPLQVTYAARMDIVYDGKKNDANAAKNGISLAEAALFEWEDALYWIDKRNDYGEVRECVIGYIDTRLYYLVYVRRDDVRRIISLRKANSREVTRYAQAETGNADSNA